MPASAMRKVWFQLVEDSGAAFQNSKPFRVLVPAGAIIDDCRDAVKAEYADSLLVGIAASTLTVYDNKAAFDAKNAFGMDMSVAGCGAMLDDALIVVVPAVTAQPTASTSGPGPRADISSSVAQSAQDCTFLFLVIFSYA